MGFPNPSRQATVAGLFAAMREHMFGTDADASPIEKRAQNLSQKQANIRAAGVREGFLAMRARSDAMAQRLEQFRNRSNPTPANDAQPVEQNETVETIVLTSTAPAAWRHAKTIDA
ncbi:MAG: hypothetical protein WBV39_07000 [Rudaea sp.]